jgi:hypothetical protein
MALVASLSPCRRLAPPPIDGKGAVGPLAHQSEVRGPNRTGSKSDSRAAGLHRRLLQSGHSHKTATIGMAGAIQGRQRIAASA